MTQPELTIYVHTYMYFLQAGTTASICFIKRGKLFIGHVGDSGIILGERESSEDNMQKRWSSKRLTRDHKPECEPELSRIQDAGGKVVSKSGVPRVVWYRPSGTAYFFDW